jgi:hypothetical protein
MRLLLLFFLAINIYAYEVKTPSDVYSVAMILKKKVEFLRKQAGIKAPFPEVPTQYNKYPRHVIQKAIEILRKINLYRISKGYGEISIPPYPAKNITPSEVYEIVKRVNAEITPFIKDKKFLAKLRPMKYVGETPNDVYQLLWSISLAFNSLLGIHGNTPNDVYELSEKLLQIIKFIRHSQNMYNLPKEPKKRPNLYANHSLYASYDFLKKLRTSEINLWIEPTGIPKKREKVVNANEVYDSLQYNIAELQRIKYRLGIERYFKLKKLVGNKNFSDIVQNIEYAKKLLPTFSVSQKVIQYPISSLRKTPNNVYAVTQEILRKISIFKNLKGIKQEPKNPPYIADLKPIYAFQKANEDIKKAIKLKTEMGFYPSEIPKSPLRPITPDDVYNIVIRLDSTITILLHKIGYKKAEEYIYKVNKQIPNDKHPSDVYYNLWKISNNLDVLLASEYSTSEVYLFVNNIKNKVIPLLLSLRIKPKVIKDIQNERIQVSSVTLKDVFNLTLDFYALLQKTQKRFNMNVSNIIIPKSNSIKLDTIYNGLSIINATLNEVLIYKGIDETEIKYDTKKYKKISLNELYANILKLNKLLDLLYKESSYEK